MESDYHLFTFFSSSTLIPLFFIYPLPVNLACHLPVLLHELLVELDNPSSPLGAGGQESGTEVQAALLLPEAGTGHDADTRRLEEAHAVELIRGAALGGGGLAGLGGQGDRWEEVHGALGLAALDALHLGEGLVEGGGALAQALKDAVVLLAVELVRGLTGLGGVDHDLDEALADDGGAEHDGDELVNVGLDLRVEADELEVAAAVAALADHALGDAVEGGELDAVVLSRVLLLQLAKDLLEAVELANEDVGLVDLVGHDDEVLLAGELEDGADVLLGEGGTRGVTGVDDYDAAHVDAIGLGLLVCAADGVQVGTPVLGLIEVVGDAGSVEDGEGGGIEGVLWDGDQDTGVGSGADGVEEGVDAGGGTGGEVDVGRVRGEAVTLCISTNVRKEHPIEEDLHSWKSLTLEELGNALLDGWNTGTGTVGTDGADALEEPLCTLNHVGLVAEVVDQDIFLLEKLGVLQQTGDLSEEGDGLLVQLLGVADVGRDDLVEGQVTALALVQRSAELLGLDGQLATDGILGRANVGVDVVDGEPGHVGGPAMAGLLVGSDFWRGSKKGSSAVLVKESTG